MVVVLPVPLTPQTSTTCGRKRARCGNGSATGSSSLATAAARASRTSMSRDLLAEPALGHRLDQHGRGLDAEVGRDQRLLELLQRRGVEPPLGDDAGDLLGQAARGARQPGLEPGEPALPRARSAIRRPARRACRPRPPRRPARRSCRPAAASPPRRSGSARTGRSGRRRRARSALAGAGRAGRAGTRSSAAAPRARSRAARSLRACLGHLRHARRRRARPGRVGEHVQEGQPGLLDQVQRAPGTSPRPRSGSRRSGRRRTTRSGRSRRRRAATSTTSARRCRRFMRLSTRSSPACTERCRCGIRRGSSATSRRRSASIAAGSSEDSRSRRSSGNSARRPRSMAPRRRLARQVRAVGGEIDAGDHDLGIAAGEQRARLGDDRRQRHAAARPAAERDDAEGAAMVAALLHLEDGPRAPLEALDRVARGLAHRHDVADQQPRRLGSARSRARSPGRSFSALPTTWSTSGIAA